MMAVAAIVGLFNETFLEIQHFVLQGGGGILAIISSTNTLLKRTFKKESQKYTIKVISEVFG